MNYEEYMIQMKGGKKYLPVAPRVKMFRDDHPMGRIEATIVEIDREAKFCMCEAVIYDADGRIISRAHGSEEARDFADYIEKAETKAVGRALSLAGFGTLDAKDLEEGQVVDTPAPVLESPSSKQPVKAAPKAKPAQKIVDNLPATYDTQSAIEATSKYLGMSEDDASVLIQLLKTVFKSEQACMEKVVEPMASTPARAIWMGARAYWGQEKALKYLADEFNVTDKTLTVEQALASLYSAGAEWYAENNPQSDPFVQEVADVFDGAILPA